MQQWTLESGILFFLSMLISSCRYASYWSLMNFMMGCQLNGIDAEDDEEREQKEEMDTVQKRRQEGQMWTRKKQEVRSDLESHEGKYG